VTADAFAQWLDDTQSSGRARSNSECARLLGVARDTVERWRAGGCDQRTALACAALLAGLAPYQTTEGPQA